MSIAISSRTAVFTAQFQVRPGPPAIPRPGQESAPLSSPYGRASRVFQTSSNKARIGATINTVTAQDSPGSAQEGAGVGLSRDPRLREGEALYGDINGDNVLDGDDIMALLKAFNTSVTEADLNGDGNVDTADLGILISAIRDFNSKNKPDDTPGDGLNRDVYPISAIDIPTGQEQSAEPKFSSLEPGDLPGWTPGGPDDPVSQPAILGDLTGDGVVNLDDLAILQQAFGSSQTTGHLVGDLNEDGRVDTADLGMMLGILHRQEEA